MHGGGKGGVHAPWQHCAGAAFGGAKYGILKFGHFLRIGVCIAEWIQWEYVLCNYTPPQLSVLFVTVCTNAIVVTIRISVADLIGGGSNTDICRGQQTPSRQ